MNRAYKVVDVFTQRPLVDNPIAVIPDAKGFSDVDMHAIARWTNLSETTFLLPLTTSEADYRLRIFTPRSELPFSGHPTIGSVHAVLDADRVRPRNSRFVQECGVGLIEISVEDGDADIEVRSFAPSCGVNEDPVCGSGNGSVAVFQRERDLLPKSVSYTAAQGQCIHRDGRVAIKIDAEGTVSLGGASVTCLDGTHIY